MGNIKINTPGTAIRRQIFVCSSVVMEPHNSLITSKNLLDD